MKTGMPTVFVIILSLFVLISVEVRSAPLTSNAAPTLEDLKRPEALVDVKDSFCGNEKFQAAFDGPRDQQYYFRVFEVFVLKKNTVKKFPRKDIFPDSPYNVDAMVYSHRTGKAYLFKGRKVWIYKYHGDEFIHYQTKKLGRTSPNILEAAFYYRGFIYLLKNGYLYAWDEQRNEVISNHVFPISYFWKDVPKKIDAVMQSVENGRTVFWKRQGLEMQYLLFDDQTKRMIKKGSFESFFPFC